MCFVLHLLSREKCFNAAVLSAGLYGSKIHVWDWTTHKRLQSLDLGEEGAIPLEIRFLHDPAATEGYVGCALQGTVFRFYRTPVSKTFMHRKK